MSGHSKWANIKHRKEKSDSKRGSMFTKLGREIAVAVKMGGGDPASNTRLRDVIAKAKANNMPNDSIARSVKKAAGEGDGSNYEEVVYEGYGPSGVAMIVETLTDNRNRTAGDIRHFFDKYGGNLGANGCVAYLFDKKGQIIVERMAGMDEDTFMMQAIDAGAEDVLVEEEYFEVLTSPDDFSAVREALENAGMPIESAEVTMIPQTNVRLEGEAVENMEKLIDRMEDHDDVQNIWHNWEQDDE